ncbi:hypothetical protein D3C85_1138890 [compost metagenome]
MARSLVLASAMALSIMVDLETLAKVSALGLTAATAVVVSRFTITPFDLRAAVSAFLRLVSRIKNKMLTAIKATVAVAAMLSLCVVMPQSLRFIGLSETRSYSCFCKIESVCLRLGDCFKPSKASATKGSSKACLSTKCIALASSLPSR